MRTPEALVRAFVRAFEARDLDAFLACFDDDATAYLPFTPRRYEGKRAIRERFARYFADMAAGTVATPPPVELRDLIVQDLAPGAAVAAFTYGEAGEHRRRSLTLRRRGDSWRVVHLHGSNARE